MPVRETRSEFLAYWLRGSSEWALILVHRPILTMQHSVVMLNIYRLALRHRVATRFRQLRERSETGATVLRWQNGMMNVCDEAKCKKIRQFRP